MGSGGRCRPNRGRRLGLVGRLFLHIVDGPAAEDLGGVPLGLDHLLVCRIQLDPLLAGGSSSRPSCRRGNRGKSKSSIIGKVWFLIAKVPFAHHTGVITCLAHQLGQVDPVGLKKPQLLSLF